MRRIDQRCFVVQSGFAIPGEKQRPVEIDEIGALRKENRRRHTETTPLLDVIRTYPSDYRVVFVGDAAMSPYEIAMAGGSVEHWNEEAGKVWLERVLNHFPKVAWLNPVPQAQWGYTQSNAMIRQIFSDRMYPLTLEGIDQATRALLR